MPPSAAERVMALACSTPYGQRLLHHDRDLPPGEGGEGGRVVGGGGEDDHGLRPGPVEHRVERAVDRRRVEPGLPDIASGYGAARFGDVVSSMSLRSR